MIAQQIEDLRKDARVALLDQYCSWSVTFAGKSTLLSIPCAYSQTEFFQGTWVKWSITIFLCALIAKAFKEDLFEGLVTALGYCPTLLSLHFGHKKIGDNITVCELATLTHWLGVFLVARVASCDATQRLEDQIAQGTPDQISTIMEELFAGR